MTPEEIRKLAIERVARAMFERSPDERGEFDSVYVPPEVRDRYRRWATPLVDALGDLLPTDSEERDHSYHMGDGTPIVDRHRRLMTEWRLAND